MKTVYTILGILISFLILWIFSLNVGQTVDIDLAFHSYKGVNLITITYLSFFTGFALGLFVFAIKYIGFKKEKFQLKKEIKNLQKEVGELQSVPLQKAPALPTNTDDTPGGNDDSPV